jgi:hypothetical protein
MNHDRCANYPSHHFQNNMIGRGMVSHEGCGRLLLYSHIRLHLNSACYQNDNDLI